MDEYSNDYIGTVYVLPQSHAFELHTAIQHEYFDKGKYSCYPARQPRRRFPMFCVPQNQRYSTPRPWDHLTASELKRASDASMLTPEVALQLMKHGPTTELLLSMPNHLAQRLLRFRSTARIIGHAREQFA